MKNTMFRFNKAVPVWEHNCETKKNHSIELHCSITGRDDYILFLAGCSSYLVFVNETFISYGPARAAHSFYKVDKISLKEHLKDGENRIVIRGVGYNINSFSHINAPSFLCAEIHLGERVIAYTSAEGSTFSGYSYPARIQKTQRYSYQRTFAEAYDFRTETKSRIQLAAVSPKHFLKRDVPYEEYLRVFPQKVFQKGCFSANNTGNFYRNREITQISDTYLGFKEDELSCGTHAEYGKLCFMPPAFCDESCSHLQINENHYADLDMGAVRTGLFSFTIEAQTEGTLLIAFDELMTENELNPFRNESSNVIVLFVKPGKCHFTSTEPYNFRYARIISKSMDCIVHDFSLHEIAFPESLIRKTFHSDDIVMQKIFDAAKLSFRANVVDTYMDCPGRERAGWLCDSFFTARVEKLLTGNSIVEKSFLTSFLLPEHFDGLQTGMLPMCYPCDVMNGEFIPNWAMWYALELYEYYERTKDAEFIAFAKEKMMKLLAYFQAYENKDGLLEGLNGVVFVDASKSNMLANQHSVSFPTNMLYAAFLSVLGSLYGLPDLLAKANVLRDKIRHLAISDNGFFCDSADYKENQLILWKEHTEACQYYAFFFKIVTPDTHPDLWNTLLYHFDYSKDSSSAYSDIHPANTFIGKYLRLDLLEQYKQYDMLYDNIRGYFSYMAERTGTLWEYISPTASCNHGFASYVIYWMDKLGLIKDLI